jgi:hypothetical protein
VRSLRCKGFERGRRAEDSEFPTAARQATTTQKASLLRRARRAIRSRCNESRPAQPWCFGPKLRSSLPSSPIGQMMKQVSDISSRVSIAFFFPRERLREISPKTKKSSPVRPAGSPSGSAPLDAPLSRSKIVQALVSRARASRARHERAKSCTRGSSGAALDDSRGPS